jgi:ABC-type Fe3+-siderophore transport system permease subunit
MKSVIVQRDVVKSGVGFGSALAIVISYTAHKSVLWAIIHGIFSWFYVVYFLITRN